MRPSAPFWGLVATLLVAAAPVAAQIEDGTAEQQPAQITLVAKEDGCPEDRTFCFELVERPDRLGSGDEVNLSLRNDGTSQHNAHVTNNSSADPDHRDTPAGAAFANTTTIGSGETANITFTVHGDEDLYIWCDMTGHEAAGMWGTVPVADQTADDRTQGNQTDETNGTGDRNGTDEANTTPEDNRSREGNSSRDDDRTGEGNQAAEDRGKENRSDQRSDQNRSSAEEGEDEPLTPNRQDQERGPAGDGQSQQAPFGWLGALVSVVLAMVLAAAFGRG